MQHQQDYNPYTPYYSGSVKYYVKTPTISGPAQFCPTETYTISNLPAGATISWSTTGGITVPANSTGSSVTATAVSGSGILTANISSACGTIQVVKSLNNNVGVTPIIPGIMGPYVSMNATNPNSINIRALCNFTSMSFIFPGATNLTARHYYFMPSVPQPTVQSGNIVNFTYNTSGFLYVEYDLPCGRVNQTIWVANQCNPWQNNFTYYPNPANTQLTVSYTPPSTLKTADGFEPMPVSETKQFVIELYDNKANLLRKVANAANGKDIVISTQDLPNGTYFLHIIDGKEVIKKQIIVQH